MCGKVGYIRERDANRAINLIKKNSGNEIPKRAYYCKECGKYHLTHYKNIAKWTS